MTVGFPAGPARGLAGWSSRRWSDTRAAGSTRRCSKPLRGVVLAEQRASRTRDRAVGQLDRVAPAVGEIGRHGDRCVGRIVRRSPLTPHRPFAEIARLVTGRPEDRAAEVQPGVAGRQRERERHRQREPEPKQRGRQRITRRVWPIARRAAIVMAAPPARAWRRSRARACARPSPAA